MKRFKDQSALFKDLYYRVLGAISQTDKATQGSPGFTPFLYSFIAW